MNKFNVGDKVIANDPAYAETFGKEVIITSAPTEPHGTYRANLATHSFSLNYYEHELLPLSAEKEIDNSERDELAKQIMLATAVGIAGVSREDYPSIAAHIFDLADAFMAEKERRRD